MTCAHCGKPLDEHAERTGSIVSVAACLGLREHYAAAATGDCTMGRDELWAEVQRLRSDFAASERVAGGLSSDLTQLHNAIEEAEESLTDIVNELESRYRVGAPEATDAVFDALVDVLSGLRDALGIEREKNRLRSFGPCGGGE
jgi:hypothetical protein